MSGSSTVAGYITPTTTALSDAALADALTAVFSGLCNIPNDLVRPRWQPEPAPQPASNVDWLAMGVTEKQPLDFPYQKHDPAANSGNGSTTLQRQELVTVGLSFYGPNAGQNVMLVRDGLFIGQNTDALETAGLKLIGADLATHVPEQVNFVWIDRYDLIVRLTRQIDLVYDIENIVEATATLTSDSGLSVVETVTETTNVR